MTCYVLSGTLNPNHSLTVLLQCVVILSDEWLQAGVMLVSDCVNCYLCAAVVRVRCRVLWLCAEFQSSRFDWHWSWPRDESATDIYWSVFYSHSEQQMFRVCVCRHTEVLLLSQFNKPVFVCLLFTCRMLAMENRPDPFASYTRLTSQKLAGRHDISKLHYLSLIHISEPTRPY